MKRINFYLTAFALVTSAHVGTLAAPRPTIPTAVESIDVTTSSNGTSADSTRFHQGACDLAPKQYWDKEIASHNAKKSAETVSIELGKRKNARGYTAWMSQMFLNMASIGNRLPITSFLTGQLAFLSDTDIADTAAVKHKSDKRSEAKNTKITDTDDAKHGLRLRGGVNTGRVSSGDSLARLEVSVLPAENPLSNDLSPTNFKTSGGAVHVDKVVERDAFKDTHVVATKIYKPHSITHAGHTVRPVGNSLHEISDDEVKAFTHDAFTPFKHSDPSDSFGKRAFDSGNTSENIGPWIIGSVLLFVLAYGIWSWIKHYCQHRDSRRDAGHDGHDPNSESADPIQTIAIREVHEADMLTDEEMRTRVCMLEHGPHIHINGLHAPEQAHVAPPRSSLSSGSGSLLALHDLIRQTSIGRHYLTLEPPADEEVVDTPPRAQRRWFASIGLAR